MGPVHMDFHPSTESLLLAAGDKSGHIGLWQVDYQSDEESNFDGVLTFKPHSQMITGLKWVYTSTSDARLYTSAFEGIVRKFDPEVTAFIPTYVTDDELSTMDIAMDERCGYAG